MRVLRKIFNGSLAVVLGVLPRSLHARLSDEFLRLRILSLELLRKRQARANPEVKPAKLSTSGEILHRYILETSPPWSREILTQCEIPGMLTQAEKQYYQYIGAYYSGRGEVVEIGPWLGQSTFYMLTSLLKNPNFADRKLHVYDDFVWRSSWMDKWLRGTNIKPLRHGESFYPIFCDQLQEQRCHIYARRQRLIATEDNMDVPAIEWAGGAIELMIVDCGRTLSLNEAWWEVFSPFFIPDRTLIVMQDWQNHKRVPELFWENMKIFTDSKGTQLDLIHEVRNAGIATFVFRSN